MDKKAFKYKFKQLCALCLAVLISAAAFGQGGGSSVRSSADETKDKYEQQLEELREQQAEIDSRMADAQSKLDEEEGNLQALTEKYNAINDKIKNVQQQTVELEDRMVDADTRLRDAKYSLEEQNARIEVSKAEFMERIRSLYVAGGTATYESVLINSTDFYDILMRMELVKRVASHDSEALEELMAQKRAIEQTEAAIEEESAKLKADMQQYSDMQLELIEQQEELDKLKAQSAEVISALQLDKDSLAQQSAQLDSDYYIISSLAETTTTTTTTTPAPTTTTPEKTESKKQTTASTTTSNGQGGTASTTTKQTTVQETTTTAAATTAQTEAETQSAENDDSYETEPVTTTTTAAPTTTTTVTTAPPADTVDGDSSRQEKIDRIIAYARSNVGGTYVWAGASFRACDCSGLVMMCYAQVGYSLPHLASSQAGMGTAVDHSSIQPGDCVFFGGSSLSSVYHAAIYIGDGKIIHAANSSEGIIVSDLASFSRYNSITTIRRYI